MVHHNWQSGKSSTNRESNHGSGVCKEHYAYMLYYVPKSSILLAATGVWKTSSVACGFSSFKIDYSDYPKSLIIRINENYVFQATFILRIIRIIDFNRPEPTC